MRTLRHLEPQCECDQGESVREKLSCEVYLSTPSVDYSGSLSTVDETICNKKRFEQLKILWPHFQFHSDLSDHDALEDECHRLC